MSARGVQRTAGSLTRAPLREREAGPTEFRSWAKADTGWPLDHGAIRHLSRKLSKSSMHVLDDGPISVRCMESQTGHGSGRGEKLAGRDQWDRLSSSVHCHRGSQDERQPGRCLLAGSQGDRIHSACNLVRIGQRHRFRAHQRQLVISDSPRGARPLSRHVQRAGTSSFSKPSHGNTFNRVAELDAFAGECPLLATADRRIAHQRAPHRERKASSALRSGPWRKRTSAGRQWRIGPTPMTRSGPPSDRGSFSNPRPGYLGSPAYNRSMKPFCASSSMNEASAMSASFSDAAAGYLGASTSRSLCMTGRKSCASQGARTRRLRSRTCGRRGTVLAGG
jgi:hypothetical protein